MMTKRYGGTIPAKPTLYNGIRYDSKLEARIAVLLTRNRVKFEYSKRFIVGGGGKYREVDFWLPDPILVCWSDFYVNALEAKGVLDLRSYVQRKNLASVGINTFVATDSIVLFWERYAFLKTEFEERYGSQ